MNTKTRLFSILALLSIFLGLTAAAPASAVAVVENCKQTHTVQPGEYLSKIAAVYKVSYVFLAELNDLEDPNVIYPGQVLCISTSPSPITPPPASGTVKVWAGSVVEDKAVTLKGKTLAINMTYSIYLSNYKHTTYVDTFAGSVKTDGSGAFSLSVTIPKNLVDVALLRVTIVNANGDKWTNWFINTTGSSVGGMGSPEISIAVDDVQEGDWVKFSVSNLPSAVTFQVYIAKGDGTGAILVGQVKSNDGGKVTVTFDLPDDYLDRDKLEIQLVNEAVEMDAEKDFDND